MLAYRSKLAILGNNLYLAFLLFGKKGRRAYADPSQNMQDRGPFARRLEAAQATELANHL